MERNQNRQIFHSSRTKSGWEVREGGETLSRHPNQQQCEEAAIAAAKKFYDDGGLAQAVLHQSDGTIREERTYGEDPGR
jgi:hypothetical protein